MTIIIENGQYPSFCPISCISWLSDRIDDIFFIILGTKTCSHFLSTSMFIQRFPNVKFATIIFEESDIGIGNINENLSNLIQKLLPNINNRNVILMGTCYTEILKIDLMEISNYLEKQFHLPFIPIETNGIESCYTEGEDILLFGLMKYFNAKSMNNLNEKNLILVGSLSDEKRFEFSREFRHLDINFAGFFPNKNLLNIPNFNRKSLVVPVHPYLNKTLRIIKRLYRSHILTTAFPIGPYGTRIFYEAIAKHFNVEFETFIREEHKIWKNLKEKTEKMKGKSIFIMGDNMMEIPLCRFLLKCGLKILEVSVPYLSRQNLKKELEIIEKYQISIVESPNIFNQLERISNLNPDLIITPNQLANPLISKGYKVVWSLKFILPQIYGFSGVQHLIKEFSSLF